MLFNSYILVVGFLPLTHGIFQLLTGVRACQRRVLGSRAYVAELQMSPDGLVFVPLERERRSRSSWCAKARPIAICGARATSN
jgi:hypothetical protein